MYEFYFFQCILLTYFISLSFLSRTYVCDAVHISVFTAAKDLVPLTPLGEGDKKHEGMK